MDVHPWLYYVLYTMSYLAQTPEGSTFDDWNVVLVEVDVIQLPELSEGVGGDILQLVIGEDEVLKGTSQSRKTIWHQWV